MIEGILLVVGILFPFLLNALGSLFVFFPFRDSSCEKAVSFSAGVMMGASFWSLLKPAHEILFSNMGRLAFIPIIFGIICGGLLIALFDLLFSVKQGGKLSSPAKLFIAVTAHNIPEGLTVGVALGSLPIVSALAVSFGIAVQNFPEGLAVSMLYADAPNGKKTGFKMGVLSAFVEPVSSVIGLLLCNFIVFLQPAALCVSAGAMIYVCASELIPKGCKSTVGAWAFTVGFCLMTALDIALSI